MSKRKQKQRALRIAERNLNNVTTLLAERIAERDDVEDKIERKSGREPKRPDRAKKLDREIAALRSEHRELAKRVRQLRGRRKDIAQRAKRLRQQIRNLASPKVVDLGLSFGSTSGHTVSSSVGHYTAGPADSDDAEAFALFRRYHEMHKGLGWAGIGYHIGITRAGTIVRLRPLGKVGAHTAGANTGRAGIVVHGSTGDRWTVAQRRGLRKALKKFGLASKPIGVHKDFGPTSCPGSFERGYRTKGRQA